MSIGRAMRQLIQTLKWTVFIFLSKALALCMLVGVAAILLTAACGSLSFRADHDREIKGRDIEKDRDELLALFHATNGPEWKNSAFWNTDVSVARWHGIVEGQSFDPVSNPVGTTLGTRVNEFVSIIDLANNGLVGEIPKKIGNLDGLQRLDLRQNQLSGEIPAELGKLELTHLILGGNQLSGEIPPELGNIRYLSYLVLGGNQLSGEIPAELGDLNDLILLDLSNNQLTGDIAGRFGKPNRFSYLDLSGNKLTGEIPASLLFGLNSLDLRNNYLTGEIPETKTSPRELYLGGNQLSGCIPKVFRYVPNNDFLSLGMNICGGGLPIPHGSPRPPESLVAALVAFYKATGGADWHDSTDWMNSSVGLSYWYGLLIVGGPRLYKVSLNGNNLSGELPAEWDGFHGLAYLHLADNDLTGEIPSGLEASEELYELDLSGNSFSGEIPPELGNLDLGRLLLSGNDLNGDIPVELADLTGLEELRLAGNRLTGAIPPELEDLPNLKVLRLASNPLTGCIPDRLQLVPDNDLWELGLPVCGGKVAPKPPPSYGDRSALLAFYDATGGPEWLDDTNWRTDEPLRKWYGVTIDSQSGRVEQLELQENGLKGEIPHEIGELADLQVLNLRRNDLSGEIPAELGNLESLRSLRLGGNRLSGEIPTELGNLRHLKYLYLGRNEFTGCLPARFQRAHNNDFLTIGLPFCGE